MARYEIPKTVKKVRVAMGRAGVFVVWNGKIGPGEWRLPLRTKALAEAAARLINTRRHAGSIEVLDGAVFAPDAGDKNSGADGYGPTASKGETWD